MTTPNQPPPIPATRTVELTEREIRLMRVALAEKQEAHRDSLDTGSPLDPIQQTFTRAHERIIDRCDALITKLAGAGERTGDE